MREIQRGTLLFGAAFIGCQWQLMVRQVVEVGPVVGSIEFRKPVTSVQSTSRSQSYYHLQVKSI